MLLLVVALAGCSDRETDVDLPEIRERGMLIALTSYSPISYFIYRGQPMGYEYELLQLLGEHLDLPVEIHLAYDIDEMFGLLESGEGDIIAYSLTVTGDRRERIAFTEPLNVTQQVLVQRKPENWREMQLHEIENTLIRSALELAGKTVYVRKASAYLTRLRNLSREIGGEIIVIEAESDLTTDDLMRMVAEGDIEFTVADENIALINQAYYNNLDVQTPVSLPQQTAWAVRHTSPQLLGAVNHWLEEAQRHVDYYVIYNKYFENRRAFSARYGSDYFPITGGTISPYDDVIRRYAEEIGWDWRLLAALIYQESQFRPRARSWAGARGLMQLMPRTAREFGAADPFEPEENIRAGVGFIKWLDDYWREEIEDDEERVKFIIASYNVGQGHVQDARRLAALHDADPNVWHGSVEEYMLKKSNPDYYNTEYVQFGYASGIEPVTYVESIFDLYAHYRKFVE
jgi:membrane-bound lytic murein transglycosylase F